VSLLLALSLRLVQIADSDRLRSPSEAKRSPLQARVRPVELQQPRETVQTTNVFRNAIPPINMLPPEILTQIADFACHTSDQAVTMTQVSRYWRSAITSYPWVWTNVTVKTITPVCRVATAFENSRGLPLRLNLQIHLDEQGTLRCMASTQGLFRFADFRPHPEPFTILSLLEPHHGRIQSLRIRFLYHDNTHDRAVTQLIRHPLFQCSFDVLDSLSLSVADACHTHYKLYATPAPSAKIGGNFPRLRSLRLSGITQILQPELRCPTLKSLSIDLPDCDPGYYTRLQDQELDFLKRHSTLTSVTIREQVVDQPVELRRVKSITLSGGRFGVSFDSGMLPTSLKVLKSLTMQVTNELTTIAARDDDGNSITCLVRHNDPLHMARAWEAYLHLPLEGVEDLYLNLTKDFDTPYDMICGLANVKTVYIAWVLGRTEKVIKKVAEAMPHLHRESPCSPDQQRLRMGRWVKDIENSRVAATRNNLFKYYVEKQGWGCV
jgi:hypothetical protein